LGASGLRAVLETLLAVPCPYALSVVARSGQSGRSPHVVAPPRLELGTSEI
jgi:hypothetical protein